jgi:hypothetical protein
VTDAKTACGAATRGKEEIMRIIQRYLVLSAIVAIVVLGSATEMTAKDHPIPKVAPNCPYGYFDYAPYECAPYGYYGPEWFEHGVFLGAGPWFHGEKRFRGRVDQRKQHEHGYRGAYPRQGEAASRPVDKMPNFWGNEIRDGRGRVFKSRTHQKTR